jgi:transcriptional regulator with XRE-family HTH domain
MNVDHVSNPLDIALGARIRVRRKSLGLSQDDLAVQVSLTFQQIQKYERGANRVSFSRLVEIARTLKCRVQDLIGDLDVEGEVSDQVAAEAVQLKETGALELIRAYSAIRTAGRRRIVVSLAQTLSKEDEPDVLVPAL